MRYWIESDILSGFGPLNNTFIKMLILRFWKSGKNSHNSDI